eukprot:660015-Ditylum_brightwellii.AAC.1
MDQNQKLPLASDYDFQSDLISVEAVPQEEVLHLVDTIRKKYLLLCKEQVFGMMDELKLYLQQSSDHGIQN